MSKVTKFAPAILATCVALAGATVRADESDILLKVLVRKGILNDSEAASVRAEVAKEKAKVAKTTAAHAGPGVTAGEQGGLLSKLDLSKSVDTLKLYGDLRLRYQYDDKDAQAESSAGVHSDRKEKDRSTNSNQRSRFRFRLRLDADVKLTDNFSAGVELQTNNVADSGNQTFTNGFGDYDIFISKAYLRYKNDWLTLSGGKFDNPFYSTDLVWDPDINPNGAAERIDFHKLFGHSSEPGFDKDGKALAAAPASPWELSLVAGQFIFFDNNEFLGPDNDQSSDAFIFETQLIGSYKFANGVKVTLAPAWFTANAGSVGTALNANSFTDSALVSGAERNLNLLLLPGDISFSIAGIKTKFLWDFSYNLDGKSRAEDTYRLVYQKNRPGDHDDFVSNHRPKDDLAFLVGFQVGENKKAGDLSFLANYRQTGISAVDPNLNDDDFALGELNTRGIKLGLAYNVTDFATFGVTYYQAWNLDKNLVGGEATGGNGIADSNVIRTLMVDFMVKF